MAKKNQIAIARSELLRGMGLTKCKKCGCMKETLENLRTSLLLQTAGLSDLVEDVEGWLGEMEHIRYACLGCEHCFPAVALNMLNQAFPETAWVQSPSCDFEIREQTWPPVAGEYFAFCEGSACPVAVSTLASVALTEALANNRPKELCIVGKTETENIGIDKLIKNTVTNPTIRVLLVAGKDSEGHCSGKTLLALWENGVDENMRVIGSPGKRPVLRNVTLEEIGSFRRQVQVVDMIGCEDVEQVVHKVRELSETLGPACTCEECEEGVGPVRISTAPLIEAKEPVKVEMDSAGYFVIAPRQEKGVIVAEHYSYNNKLQRVIEGKDARSIYSTIIENGWVTQLSHAAYLGKELAKAELSIKLGLKYVQDGA